MKYEFLRFNTCRWKRKGIGLKIVPKGRFEGGAQVCSQGLPKRLGPSMATGSEGFWGPGCPRPQAYALPPPPRPPPQVRAREEEVAFLSGFASGNI